MGGRNATVALSQLVSLAPSRVRGPRGTVSWRAEDADGVTAGGVGGWWEGAGEGGQDGQDGGASGESQGWGGGPSTSGPQACHGTYCGAEKDRQKGAGQDQGQDGGAGGAQGAAPAQVLAADEHVGQDHDGDQQRPGAQDAQEQGAAEGAQVGGDLGLQVGQRDRGLHGDRVEGGWVEQADDRGLGGGGEAAVGDHHVQRVGDGAGFGGDDHPGGVVTERFPGGERTDDVVVGHHAGTGHLDGPDRVVHAQLPLRPGGDEGLPGAGPPAGGQGEYVGQVADDGPGRHAGPARADDGVGDVDRDHHPDRSFGGGQPPCLVHDHFGDQVPAPGVGDDEHPRPGGVQALGDLGLGGGGAPDRGQGGG